MSGRGPVCRLVFAFIMAASAAVYGQDYAQDDTPEPEYAEWDAVLRGSYRNLFVFQHTDTFMKDVYSSPREKNLSADLNRFSFSPEISYGENFIFHADADIESIFSNYNKTIPFDLYWQEADYNAFTKPSVELLNNRSTYLSAEFRNLYVRMTKGTVSGTIGRQQVRFGSSRLWNPLDILNPYSPLHVEGADEQNGIDAIRLDWYPGESTELSCVFNPVRENDELNKTNIRSSNYAARFKTGFSEFDAALLAARTARRNNAGFDFQFVILDGILTGVILWSDPQEGRGYIQCGAGYEYTFLNGLYILVEYFYNELPAHNDKELMAAMQEAGLSVLGKENYYVIANRIITYNSHYISAAAGYDFHPLLRGEMFVIYDIQGSGFFYNISMKFNAMQDLDITGGIISSFVDKQDQISDFVFYDRKPLLYAAADLYF